MLATFSSAALQGIEAEPVHVEVNAVDAGEPKLYLVGLPDAAVKESKTKLTEYKYPVIFRAIKDMGRQYIDGRLGIDTLHELARWIDSLDRM